MLLEGRTITGPSSKMNGHSSFGHVFSWGMDLGRSLPGLVCFPPLGTPIGRLNFGGVLRRGRGTGFDGFRVYGMYAVVIVIRGRGHYRDEHGFAADLTAGDLIVVFPDLAHQYGPPEGETWDEIFVAFEGPSFDAWRAEGLDPAYPVWSLGSATCWIRRLRQLLRRKIRTRADSCAAVGELHRLIAECLSLRQIETSPTWLDVARHDLADPTQGEDLGAIASIAGLSVDSFRRAFRAATGDPPARFRLRQRIAAGASLLHRRDLQIKQIAQMLNFCDEFHFSKVFKKHYGKSPQAYRQSVTDSGMARFNPRAIVAPSRRGS